MWKFVCMSNEKGHRAVGLYSIIWNLRPEFHLIHGSFITEVVKMPRMQIWHIYFPVLDLLCCFGFPKQVNEKETDNVILQIDLEHTSNCVGSQNKSESTPKR